MKDRPPVQSWKESIVDKATASPPVPYEAKKDLSIADLMQKALGGVDDALSGTINEIKQASVGRRTPSRESVMNLKDCLAMLAELQDREKEYLDGLSDDELEKIAK